MKLPNHDAIFPNRRQQVEALRAGRKPDAVKSRAAGASPLRESISLANKPAVRRKLPELHLCAGGVVQFF